MGCNVDSTKYLIQESHRNKGTLKERKDEKVRGWKKLGGPLPHSSQYRGIG